MTHSLIIGTCLKHGRKLAICDECGPGSDFYIGDTSLTWEQRYENLRVRVQARMWENHNRAEVERLRSAGELMVACYACRGRGKAEPRCHAIDSPCRSSMVDCGRCEGNGWLWSEKQ